MTPGPDRRKMCQPCWRARVACRSALWLWGITFELTGPLWWAGIWVML